MEKVLRNVTKITTEAEYELLNLRLKNLIIEATEEGFLSDVADEDNEYTREMLRIGLLMNAYEDEYINFSFQTPSKSVASGQLQKHYA